MIEAPMWYASLVQHKPLIKSLARCEWEDLFQDTATKLHKQYGWSCIGVLNLNALVRSTINSCHIDSKRKRRIRVVEIGNLDFPADSGSRVQERGIDLDRPLAMLPVKHARIFRLHLEGWTVPKIAARLNLHREKVKTDLRRAKLVLKSALTLNFPRLEKNNER